MTAEPFAIDTLSLLEIEDIEEAIGMGFSQAGEDESLALPYAIYWVAHRRSEPALTFDEVKALPMKQITAMVTEDSPLESDDDGSS